MFESVLLLVVSLGIILAGAELFTNGIEWFGRKLDLAEGAVGSVLAAVGTALPETIIPIIAIFFSKGKSGHDIGIGAILGAPLMLSTLACFVTGMAVFIFKATGKRSLHMKVDIGVLGRDLKTFLFVYPLAIGAMFMPWRAAKLVVAVILVGSYVYYVRQTFLHESASGEQHELGRLHFHRKHPSPKLRIIVVQVVSALILIVVGAEIFVENLSKIALSSGVSAFVLATIITPIATELPEKFNSVTWIRRRKDTLAMGNITGAMVFQSSVLPAIGILATGWALNLHAAVTGMVAILAALFLWASLFIKKRLSPYALLAGIVFYGAFLTYVLTNGPRH